MPDAQTPDGAKMPTDTHTLITVWLPKYYQKPVARPDLMLTESGRMALAQEYAKWDLCDSLRRNLERQTKEQ